MVSRKDLYERVSVTKISVANSLLSTSAFQRGWVSQTISAFGNDSRRAATAGKVWTISPRDPRRTTRKRGSGMRRLANRVQEFSRGVILGVAHDGHTDAQPFGDSTHQRAEHDEGDAAGRECFHFCPKIRSRGMKRPTMRKMANTLT